MFGNRCGGSRTLSFVMKSVTCRLSTETCDIPVTGYIQSTKVVYAKALQTWMGNELEWRLVPGGLCGSAEFTKDILKSGEEMAKYTVYGKLGLNVFGSKEVLCFALLTSDSTIWMTT